jgi:DNA-binding response OmpR family regulator
MLCRRLRAHSDVPVFMLTAMDEDIDRIMAWRSAPVITSRMMRGEISAF